MIFCVFAFSGQMLMNWFAQSLQSIASSMTTTLNESDLITLTLQYCTNLLSAGVIRQLDTSQPNVDSFKVSLRELLTFHSSIKLRNIF